MQGINTVLLAGNLARDPELFRTQGGKSRVKITVAVENSYRTNDGKIKKEASFFYVVAWENQADACMKYLKKGRPVFVEGRLNVRSYDSPEGKKKWITEINAHSVKFLGYSNEREKSFGEDSSSPSSNEVTDIENDQIPF
ncbi:MAG: single-stranded DNA-binding protein [Candidatus Riflebacteria bacterium]|nr:single-stranded DNA-binding protein [Candidatus Riflebacteria bacterium]